MNEDKRKALESAGWKFGSADEFLGERPMSDSDKMRAEFEIAAKQYNYLTVRLTDGDYADSETRSIWNFYQLGYQAGRKAEREAIFIEWENGEIMAAEVERLRAELAAAKAASVVPVRVLNIFECVSESDRYIELRTGAEADTFDDWLRDRMKDTPPPAT